MLRLYFLRHFGVTCCYFVFVAYFVALARAETIVISSTMVGLVDTPWLYYPNLRTKKTLQGTNISPALLNQVGAFESMIFLPQVGYVS